MKIYYCDICGTEIDSHRKLILKHKFPAFNTEVTISASDDHGFDEIDVCKDCENHFNTAIKEELDNIINLKFVTKDPRIKEPDKTELYFDDREICKFYCKGECTNINIPEIVNCDGYSDSCYYRDSEKKTLSEAIIKEDDSGKLNFYFNGMHFVEI